MAAIKTEEIEMARMQQAQAPRTVEDVCEASHYEPFHAEQCGEACKHYRTARYLACPGDLARALKGERFSMGLCQAVRKFLVSATQESCARFCPVGERDC